MISVTDRLRRTCQLLGMNEFSVIYFPESCLDFILYILYFLTNEKDLRKVFLFLDFYRIA